MAILEQMQTGRPALIKKDGGEMLIAIVLDRPLAEAQALVNTGEDRLWESKFCIPFQPQKWASYKSKSSVTSSCASCGFLRSRLESQSWNSFNPFPIVNRVSAGVPTPPDSGKTPQLKTSKLAQNCGKTEILHLQPSYGICWSHEIETLPSM